MKYQLSLASFGFFLIGSVNGAGVGDGDYNTRGNPHQAILLDPANSKEDTASFQDYSSVADSGFSDQAGSVPSSNRSSVSSLSGNLNGPKPKGAKNFLVLAASSGATRSRHANDTLLTESENSSSEPQQKTPFDTTNRQETSTKKAKAAYEAVKDYSMKYEELIASMAPSASSVNTKDDILKHFTHINRKHCRLVVFFHLAKKKGFIGGVVSIQEVKVDNFRRIVTIVYAKRPNVRSEKVGKKLTARVKLHLQVSDVKPYLRHHTMELPKDCVANIWSKYFVLKRDVLAKSRVETVVIDLDTKPEPFRMPRAIGLLEDPHTALSAPNEWIKNKCSVSLSFSRWLTTWPFLRIDPFTETFEFDNEELKDLSSTIPMTDGKMCDCTSPTFTSYKVRKNNLVLPEWQIQVYMKEGDNYPRERTLKEAYSTHVHKHPEVFPVVEEVS